MAFDLEVGLLVIGSGAGGLVAALRAKRTGTDVLVVEKRHASSPEAEGLG